MARPHMSPALFPLTGSDARFAGKTLKATALCGGTGRHAPGVKSHIQAFPAMHARSRPVFVAGPDWRPFGRASLQVHSAGKPRLAGQRRVRRPQKCAVRCVGQCMRKCMWACLTAYMPAELDVANAPGINIFCVLQHFYVHLDMQLRACDYCIYLHSQPKLMFSERNLRICC